MRRLALAAVATVTVFAGAAAFHAPLLRAFAPASACPVQKATLESLEDARTRGMPGLHGDGAAPSHAALGFEIGRTTRTEAARPGCAWEVADALLHCDEPGGTLVARFDRAGVLVGLDRRLAASSPEGATAAFAARARGYESTFGAPHTRTGQPTVAFLSSPLSQAGVRYRFQDLAIDLTVTQLGHDVVVREQVREVRAQGG